MVYIWTTALLYLIIQSGAHGARYHHKVNIKQGTYQELNTIWVILLKGKSSKISRVMGVNLGGVQNMDLDFSKII